MVEVKLSQLSSVPATVFHQRRQSLLGQLPPNSVLVIGAASSYIRNGDVEHAYRQDSDFYYLTGFAEPESVLLLRNTPVKEPASNTASANHVEHNKDHASLILCRPKDKLREIWDGHRLGVDAAADALALQKALSINELASTLDAWLDGVAYVYCSPQQAEIKQPIEESCARLRGRQRQGAQAPRFQADLGTLVHEMRLFKSPEELALMRQAADISAQAHIHLMQQCAVASKQGTVFEYQLAAHFQHACSMAGSQRLAYGSIVAGGANACVLHYVDNHQALHNGDLVLVDAGCEWDYYAADITRTFPVNGHFSAPQKAIYNLVLEALDATLAVIKDGVPVNCMQDTAAAVITKGLVYLGILQGDPEVLIKNEAYREFYMHGVGHWLGMDVHDVGQYKHQGQWRKLQAGMVTTVEPGIYIAPNNDKVDAKWWGIGVRIEDDVVVTQNGHENLTRQAPVTVEAIEALMQHAQQAAAALQTSTTGAQG